ncbi:hypothetical protein GCM10008967_14640 [Bacillus carboniphilus]|uniref:NodB homology domain-containing protein n=1 Tax=Bacillus carboniphilus TaxID=86663 RepID=A0ABN0W4S6_9BACI
MKRFMYLLVFMALFITACNNEETQGTPTPQPVEEDNNTTEEQPTDIGTDIDEEDSNKQEDEEEETEEVDGETEEPSEPQYYVNTVNWSIKPIDSANEKVVLLTIDDAPDKYAVEMAHTLKELDVPAIFFVNGHFIDTPEEQEKLKTIYELGFHIGNHTYNHPLLRDLPEDKQREEIVKLNQMIEEVIGEKPKFFRAPHGVNTDISHQVIEEEGMIAMNWTYGYDWEKDYLEKDALTKIMLETPYLNDGANLLMHDRSWTNEALKGIVEGLREKGYEFVDPSLITKREATE